MSQRSVRSSALIVAALTATSFIGGCSAEGQSAGKTGKVPITTSSATASAAYLKGRTLGENLRNHDSRALLSEAVRNDSSFALAHYLLALNAPTAKEFNEQLAQAVSLASKASEGERLMILGLQAGANGDPQAQLGYYEKLVAAYPDDERAHFLAGGAYFGDQDYERAIGEYKKALEIAPDFAPAYNLVGYALRATGNYAEAEQSFKKYIDLIPQDPNPYDSYAELLLKMGRFDESVKLYRKALEVDSNFAPSRAGIATNLMYQGKHEAARAETWKAYQAARNDGERRGALFTAAVTYADEGKFDQAVGELIKEYAVAEGINDTAAMAADEIAMGDVLLEAGKPGEARGRYQHALELQERSSLSAEAKENARLVHEFKLGRVSASRGELSDARRHAEAFMKGASAKKSDIQIRQGYELTGRIALKEKKYDAAVAALAQANQQDPYVLYLLSQAYEGKGEAAKAHELFEQASSQNTLPAFNYAFVRAKAKRMKA
jgi:tetratricopeptide (TPR) repeat protein